MIRFFRSALLPFFFVTSAELYRLSACSCEPSEDADELILTAKGSDQKTYKLKFMTSKVTLATEEAYLCHPAGVKIASMAMRMTSDFDGHPHGCRSAPPTLETKTATCIHVTEMEFEPTEASASGGNWDVSATTTTKRKVVFKVEAHKE